MSIPRNEYPRPQFVRRDWLNLNGAWEFEIDPGDSGRERGLLDKPLSGTITVPFCPESKLSGIGNTDYLNVVWYRRSATIPKDWAGRQVMLHFQGCDYDTTVWVNGHEVVRHRGGWTPFSASLKGVAQAGETMTIVVRARDFSRTGAMPMGKQSSAFANNGCHYTRTTGIWQTVWLEPVSPVHMGRPRVTPNVPASKFELIVPVVAFGESRKGHAIRATLKKGGESIATAQVQADIELSPRIDLPVPEQHRTLWAPGEPFLYDIDLELLDPSGKSIDSATTYGGLRSVSIDGKAVTINGKSVFQRLVLDQGYYPDGILTAPSDQALIDDITLSMSAGFNGARLHQKVFEERFLYHADRLGYLCWGEFGDWGIDRDHPAPTYVTQWLEALHRDYSHPSIIGWCGLNETSQELSDAVSPLSDLTHAFFLAAKAIDPTRPVLDASGYSHRVPQTDIYDCHDYDQDPATVCARHAGTSENNVFINAGGGKGAKSWSVGYRGQPYFVSEFGGAWWNPAAKPEDPSWGYGDRPKTIDEFYERFAGLCAALRENPAHFGYCYTQLTDVYQEQNGIFLFDRSSKFDLARLRAAQQKRAAIEGD